MTDESIRRDDEDEGSQPEAPEYGEADAAEAEEAAAAAAEEDYGLEEEELYGDEEERQAQIQEAMVVAQRANLHARASWALVHKELLLLLFANCLFFAGVLAAWSRAAPGQSGDPATYLHGLDTIRGTLIFALAIFGFWILVLNLWFRQLIVWPFLINALFALWVGIPGFTRTIGSPRWDQARAHLDDMQTKSFLDKILVPMSSIPPAYWLLTVGGALVLVVLLKGVISGASASKAAAQQSGGGRRRRR